MRTLMVLLVVALASVAVPGPASAVTVPDMPYRVSTFPVADGVGLQWQGTAAVFHIEHRLSPTGEWSEIAQVVSDSEIDLTVDHDVLPGQYVELRVYGETGGLDGPAATVTTTRPATVPTIAPASAMADAASDSSIAPQVFRSSDPDTSVSGLMDTVPVVSATAVRNSTRTDQVSFNVGTIPGPGTYVAGTDTAFGLRSSTLSDTSCSSFGGRLVVRRVLFADDLTPLVFDGSWQSTCANGTVSRVELRLGAGEDLAVPASTPGAVGPLTTWSGTPKSQPVTIVNFGPGALHLGNAAVTDGDVADWSADTGCDDRQLAAGASCTVTVGLSTSAAGSLDAQLEIPMSDATGDLAPYVVTLHGCGGTVPGAPPALSGGGLLTGAELHWIKPAAVCDLPLLRYEIHRRAYGSNDSWTMLPAVAPSSTEFFDATLPEDGASEYQVRAVNAVGASAWSASWDQALNAVGMVTTVRSNGAGPHHLTLTTGFQSAISPQTSTVGADYDWSDPAFSPAGSKLVVSRSTNPGDGSDGGYDLYLTTVDDLFGRSTHPPVQLTDEPGAEIEAAFSPDTTEVAFTHVASDGTRTLQTMPTSGGTPQTLGSYTNAAWDPTAAHTLVAQGTGAEPLQRIDLDQNSTIPIAGTQGARDPDVAADGTLAYIDASGNLATLPSTAAAGAPATVVLSPASGHALHDPTYSPSMGLYVIDLRTDPYYANYPVLIDTLNDFHDPVAGLSAYAPGIRDIYAPSIHITSSSGALVTGSQTVQFSYRDGLPYYEETPHVAVQVSCSLDDASYAPCSSPVTYDNLSDGSHRLSVRAVDETGKSNTDTLDFTSDRTAPTVHFTAPSRATTRADAIFSWTATDPSTQVTSYQVSWERADAGQPLDDWNAAPSSTRLEVRLEPGDEACVQVRATNAADLISRAYTRCTARPYDDAALTSHRSWRHLTTTAALDGTLAVATTKGASLTTPGAVSGRRFAVLAQTCSRCGSARVYLGSHDLGTISLHSRHTRSRVWAWLPMLATEQRGRLRLVTTSRASVRIDAVYASRD